jgi:hypothetical protein
MRKKVRPVQQMLDDPNKGIHKTFGSWGALSKLWRIFLRDNHVSGYRFWRLMDHFLNDPKNRSKKNNGEHTDNRGNLNKEFSNPAMSWKVFCKALRFAQIREFRITIETRHQDGHISTHRTFVNLDDNMLLDDPRFVEELENSTDDPSKPNLPVPEDQEPIVYLDPDPDEAKMFNFDTVLPTLPSIPSLNGEDDEEEEEEEESDPDRNRDDDNDDPIYQ